MQSKESVAEMQCDDMVEVGDDGSDGDHSSWLSLQSGSVDLDLNASVFSGPTSEGYEADPEGDGRSHEDASVSDRDKGEGSRNSIGGDEGGRRSRERDSSDRDVELDSKSDCRVRSGRGGARETENDVVQGSPPVSREVAATLETRESRQLFRREVASHVRNVDEGHSMEPKGTASSVMSVVGRLEARLGVLEASLATQAANTGGACVSGYADEHCEARQWREGVTATIEGLVRRVDGLGGKLERLASLLTAKTSCEAVTGCTRTAASRVDSGCDAGEERRCRDNEYSFSGMTPPQASSTIQPSSPPSVASVSSASPSSPSSYRFVSGDGMCRQARTHGIVAGVERVPALQANKSSAGLVSSYRPEECRIQLSGFGGEASLEEACKEAIAKLGMKLVDSECGGGKGSVGPNTTHIILPRAEVRTIRSFKAALSHKWCVTADWLIRSRRAGSLVHESLVGFRFEKEPFKGRRVHAAAAFLEDTSSTSKGYVRELVCLGGGSMCESERDADLVLVSQHEQKCTAPTATNTDTSRCCLVTGKQGGCDDRRRSQERVDFGAFLDMIEHTFPCCNDDRPECEGSVGQGGQEMAMTSKARVKRARAPLEAGQTLLEDGKEKKIRDRKWTTKY